MLCINQQFICAVHLVIVNKGQENLSYFGKPDQHFKGCNESWRNHRRHRIRMRLGTCLNSELLFKKKLHFVADLVKLIIVMLVVGVVVKWIELVRHR